MTQLFISHSHVDVACAERLRTDLEAAGYVVWKDTQSIPPGSPSYVRAIESGIRGSAATLVIWSQAASESEWVERELLYSQQLKKPIFPVFIDTTPAGVLLVSTQNIKSAPPCADAAKQLLPYLPRPDSDPELQEVRRLLGHDHIKENREGIEKAAELIRASKHREELLAALDDLSRNALYDRVREPAKKVLDAEKPKDPPARSNDSRYMFPVNCTNGHTSWFDRRIVCTDKVNVKRSMVRGGKPLNDVLLKCSACGEEMVVPVDCDGL